MIHILCFILGIQLQAVICGKHTSVMFVADSMKAQEIFKKNATIELEL
jgi:hypothetical protein